MTTNTRTLSAILGGSPELALFEAFAFRSEVPLSPAQASRFSGVAWATAHRKIIEWDTHGILSCVGKEGKSNLYVLNSYSKTVNILSKAVRTAVIELFDSENEVTITSKDDLESELQTQSFRVSGEVDTITWSNPTRIQIAPALF